MDEPLILPLAAGMASITLATVGGKGANLARLAQAGFPVPDAFLLTTHAYRAYVEANELDGWILATARDTAQDDPAALEQSSQAIRARFAAGTMPPALAEALRAAYAAMGGPPVAVRSSATAEDLPEMSFAGQQDTFLNIIGAEALLRAVVGCWSSLWTGRAMSYRSRNGIAHEEVALAVVVQEMVPSEASGVLFTVNPLTGQRAEIVIDATLGLGEALVSGQVEPDHYVVDMKRGQIANKTLGAKALSIRGKTGGETITVQEDAATRQALPDAAILELAQMGQRVAAHFGAPQDIEWGWAEGKLFLLQSRPITSLYPVPEGMSAEPLQFLFSFGAIQGVLDPLTPLGQDVLRMFFANGGRLFGSRLKLEQSPLTVAGERLYVNLTGVLRHPVGRRVFRAFTRLGEPGTHQVVNALWDDPRLAPSSSPWKPGTLRRLGGFFGPFLARLLGTLMQPTRAWQRVEMIEALIDSFQARAQRTTTLAERVALLEEMCAAIPTTLVPLFLPTVASGVLPLRFIDLLTAGQPEGASLVWEITRGLPHNVTTEMDLALWEVARSIQQDPASASHFASETAEALSHAYLAGDLPERAQGAIRDFLKQYGMRGLAEIDFGRGRWREDPTPLMQVLQSYINIQDERQAPDRVFKRGAEAAEAAIERLAAGVGEPRATLVRWLAGRVRQLAGLRESPKFAVIRLFGIMRASLLQSARELVAQGLLEQPEDIFFLRLRELRAIAATGFPSDYRTARAGWPELVAERRARYEREKQRRQVPRVLLSDGESFYEGVRASGEVGEGELVGSPVSPGTVEGIVHVVWDPHQTQLSPGEILVCHGTDPAWTPLFLAAGGLVMEVGGLMTHGSVVAREYGIPAVVGVNEATLRLKSGQRVRVDGSAGRVTLLE